MGKLVLLSALFLGQIDSQIPAAIADAQKIPEQVRHNLLYLTLDNFPDEKEREDAVRTLSGHVNQLSRATDIQSLLAQPGLYYSGVVPGTGAKLIRLDIGDFGWKRETIERLAKVDPYFHAKIETVKDPAIIIPAGYEWRKLNTDIVLVKDGVAVGGFQEGSGQYQRMVRGIWVPGQAQSPVPYGKNISVLVREVFAPWVNPKIVELSALLNSQVPILRADWFFNQTIAQVDRVAGYYDVLGIKNEADFQELIGFDPKKKRRKVELREAVAKSGVTLKARAIVRETAEEQGYWRTLDFKKAVDKLNPLRVLGRTIDEEFLKADVGEVASEVYGGLPNGMWCFLLVNNKGETQATAPDFIASDSRSISNDRRVAVGIGCIRCHTNGGLQDINGWAKNLLKPPLALQSPDYDQIRLLRQQYFRDIKSYIERDRKVYETAVFAATGWDSKVYSAKISWMWSRYEDAEVDAAYVARDLGMTENELVARLEAYAKAHGSIDPVLSVFLLTGDRKQPIDIRQFEELIPVLMTTLYSTKGG